MSDMFFLMETWLRYDEFVSLNETTPSCHMNKQVPEVLRGTWQLSSTRTCHLSLILNRFPGLPAFTSITLPKSGASWLRVMLKKWSMALLLLDWPPTTSSLTVEPVTNLGHRGRTRSAFRIKQSLLFSKMHS